MASEDLTSALDAAGAAYELLPHAHTESAVAEAKALGLEPDDVAKTLVVKTAEGYLRAVVPASCRLDERKVRDMTGGDKKDVHLASEDDLRRDYPDFDLGAVPPVVTPPCSRPARTSSRSGSRPPISCAPPAPRSRTSAGRRIKAHPSGRGGLGGGLDAAALLCAVGSSTAPPRRPSGGRCAKRRERRASAFRREFGASTRPALRRGAAGCAHRARPAATCRRRRAVGA